jgi:hypothetical protein
MILMNTTHPEIPLLAFIDSDFGEADADQLRAVGEELAAKRHHWVLGEPRFVDETDDQGVRTVGILHHLYAAFDETGRLLDEGIDREQLDEVRTIVAALQSVSARTGIDLGLELDGDSVGWVERGRLTEDLRVGLLEAWASRFA